SLSATDTPSCDPVLVGTTELRRAGRALEEALSSFAVEDVGVAEAQELLGAVSGWGRRLDVARVALCRRVTGAGAHQAMGERDAASYLAKVSGTSRAKARGELELAERLEHLGEVGAAVRSGRISADQARVIAPAAEADPAATNELLGAAGHDSLAELAQRAARTERAALGEEAQEEKERRVHERRYCRTWTPPTGGVRIDAWLSTLEGAKVMAALTKKTDQLLEGTDEPVERVRADALVALCCGERVATEVTVRVDAGALVRGAVEGTEVCEVPGMGPVSVAQARSLLGDALWTLLVTNGADISTVTSTSRVVPRRLRKALEARDECCVVPGCGARLHLELDHWRLDFAEGGLTCLDNMCRLCRPHHMMKTMGLLHLGGGPGRWFLETGPRPARPGRPHAAASRPATGNARSRDGDGDRDRDTNGEPGPARGGHDRVRVPTGPGPLDDDSLARAGP
ncbi:MAG: DUF222 domain-containing protein, partial [Acidimicrobiales bacterium]